MSGTLERKSSMTESAKLTFENDEVDLPIVVGTEGERAFDISNLRAKPATSPSTRGTSTPARRPARLRFSTAIRGFFAIGAIPSNNWPSIAISSKSPIC